MPNYYPKTFSPMKQLAVIDLKVTDCSEGLHLRYYHTSGGWHYLHLPGRASAKVSYANKDIHFKNKYSRLSKEARVLKKDTKQIYSVAVQDVAEADKAAILGVLSSERVEAYLSNKWVAVYVPRQTFLLRPAKADLYNVEFTFETKKYSTLDRKLYINGELVELEDSEPVPLNKQTNDIAELKDRQTDFTPDFKVERTRINSRIFKQAGLIGNTSTLPYSRTPARYVEDGVELISNGYMVLLNTTEDYFNVVLYSGNSDFFKTLEGLKLSALNLSRLNHAMVQEVFATTPEGVRWLMFEPSKDGNGLASHNTNLFNFRPFVNVRLLFEQIITAQGWVVTGDTSVIDCWLMCGPLQPVLTDHVAKAALTAPSQSAALLRGANSSIITDAQNMFAFRVSSSVIYSGTNPGIFGTFKDANLLLPNRPGKYRFTVSGQFQMHGSPSMRVTAARYELGVWMFRMAHSEVIALNTNNDILQDFSVVYEYEVTSENRLQSFTAFSAEIDYPGTGVFNSFSVTAKLVESSVKEGDMLDIATLMPDLGQDKFIKNISNMYGLVPQPNSATKTLNFWKFDRVIANKVRAKDWSAYLHEDDTTLTYRVGNYAAVNTLKYKESDEVPTGYADGAIRVENPTLEASKDMFTLDFKPSLDILYSGKAISLIPICEVEAAGAPVYKNIEDKDPRVVLSKFVTGAPVYMRAMTGDAQKTITEYYAACFLDEATNRDLSFERGLIPQHYGGLQRILSRARVYAPKMHLPSTEVLNLDHSVPVYLAQNTAYYYVNKVTGYKANSLTTVELIEIP